LRVVLEGDEYSQERYRTARHLLNHNLIEGAPWCDVAETYEVIYVASDRGQQIIDRFCAQWEAELDPNTPPGSLKPVAANVCIDSSPTWMVEAAAEIEALASSAGVSPQAARLPKNFRNSPAYRGWLSSLQESNGTGS